MMMTEYERHLDQIRRSLAPAARDADQRRGTNLTRMTPDALVRFFASIPFVAAQ